uniref:Phosphatidylinositol transfer protein N-terminal domain-containing protein n=1 Tax=Iconisemion striatum TaxID=60296 RepID=A0A1A7Z3C5_9TELE
MPLTVEEYKIGQLYMISKHSCEESDGGDGVEVVRNEQDTHPQHGVGQVTEKRIYLTSKLPIWIKTFVPQIFYVTETAWNFYPYTITEYSVFGDTPTPADSVSFLDILSDPIPEKNYKTSEDLSLWRSDKTSRGPLERGWRDNHEPIMCSYKRVWCSFEVFGFQTRTEGFVHKNIKDILLVAHRQAVAWLDEWHGLSLGEVRKYEKAMQETTNSKVKSTQNNSESHGAARPVLHRSISVTDQRSLEKMGVMTVDVTDASTLAVPRTPVRLHSVPE